MRVESGLSPGYKLQSLGRILNDIHQKESIESIPLTSLAILSFLLLFIDIQRMCCGNSHFPIDLLSQFVIRTLEHTCHIHAMSIERGFPSSSTHFFSFLNMIALVPQLVLLQHSSHTTLYFPYTYRIYRVGSKFTLFNPPLLFRK